MTDQRRKTFRLTDDERCTISVALKMDARAERERAEKFPNDAPAILARATAKEALARRIGWDKAIEQHHRRTSSAIEALRLEVSAEVGSTADELLELACRELGRRVFTVEQATSALQQRRLAGGHHVG